MKVCLNVITVCRSKPLLIREASKKMLEPSSVLALLVACEWCSKAKCRVRGAQSHWVGEYDCKLFFLKWKRYEHP